MSVACLDGQVVSSHPWISASTSLHGQVRTLTMRTLMQPPRPRACSLLEALEGTERIGQVGLKDDARLVAAHVRLIENRGEDKAIVRS